jgi:hypothetical protein
MYEVLDKQTRGGVSILNVYHVERNDPSVTAGGIAVAYDDTVLADLVGLQSEGLTHVSIDVRSLSNPLDFASLPPFNAAGTRPGEQLSTFNAFTMQYPRTRTDMRNGQKRYDVGVESDVVANGWSGSMITAMAAVALATVNDWVRDAFPAEPQGKFVILKRVCIIQPPPTPCPGFRLPENDGELVFYRPIAFVGRPNRRSQVSRKVL